MSGSTGLQYRGLRSALSFMVAALLIGSISYVGTHTYKASHAASGANIYATPDSGSLPAGSNLSVTIRENSGSEAVNSVQASMNYDASKLQFVSLTEGGAFPVTAATSTSNPGVIRVGRANSNSPVTGDQPIVTVNFTVTGSSGTAAISFDKAYSFVVSSADNRDILQTVGSASFTITSAGGSGGGSKPVMYIAPPSGSLAPGDPVSATVRVNAFSAGVTTVEAAVSYPANQLQLVSVSESGPFIVKQRTNTPSGSVDIIRSISGGGAPVNGDNPVVTLNFKTIGSSGNAPISFTGASAVYDNSGTGQNILDSANSAGASYAIAAAGAGGSGGGVTPPPPPPGGGTGGTGTSGTKTPITVPSQSITIGGSGKVALKADSSGNVLTQLGGQVELTPVVNPGMFARNPNDTIKKVEYWLDGKLISIQTSPPYTYKFDTRVMRNGTYAMTIKTYYSSGTVDQRTDKLLVDNKVTLAYVLRHYLVSILALAVILGLLAGVMWKLVLPKLLLKPQTANADVQDGLYGLTAGPAPTPQAPGLTASDPTVIKPAASANTGNIFSDVLPASPAAQTTQALPLTPIAASSPKPPPVTGAVNALQPPPPKTTSAARPVSVAASPAGSPPQSGSGVAETGVPANGPATAAGPAKPAQAAEPLKAAAPKEAAPSEPVIPADTPDTSTVTLPPAAPLVPAADSGGETANKPAATDSTAKPAVGIEASQIHSFGGPPHQDV